MTPSKAPSEAQERFEFQSKDGSWQPCRNVRDAAMWAADGWTIRQVEETRTSLAKKLNTDAATVDALAWLMGKGA